MPILRTAPTAIAHTGFASLGSTVTRALAKVSNSRGYPGLEFQATYKTGATVNANGIFAFYLLTSLDGTTWSNGYAGTEGAITLTNTTAPRLFAQNDANVDATTFKTGVIDVIGGASRKDLLILPLYWAIAVQNLSGAGGSVTETDYVFTYNYTY